MFQKTLQEEPTEEEYLFWKRMLKVYVTKAQIPEDSQLEVLFVLCGIKSFGIVEQCLSLEEALSALDKKYIKASSAIMTRHKLLHHQQRDGQSIEAYLAELQ